MKLKVVGVGLALLCALWVPGRAQQLPKWLTDAKARESRLAAPVEVVSEDGWLRTKVPGAVTHKVVLEDGGYAVKISLDGNTTVHCDVRQAAVGLAAFLASTSEGAFGVIQETLGPVGERVVESSDAGSAGPHPFMSLQWIFLAGQQGEQAMGSLKQYVAAVDEVLVYCMHDDLGYAKTFDTVTRALTTHLRTGREPAPLPDFKDVLVTTLNGNRIGVITTTMKKDAAGDTQVVMKSAQLMQLAPGKLASQDVTDVQWVGPDGSLINAMYSEFGNGEVRKDMVLEPQGERWRAHGTIQGKQIDVELPAAPSSYVAQAQARRRLMAQANPVGARLDEMTWSELDLTRLMPGRATVLAPVGADSYTVREEFGDTTFDAVLDKQLGTTVSAKLPVGPVTMSFERIYRHGSF